MRTKKTITFTMCEEIIDEIKAIKKDENINLSAIAQKLFVEWLCTRNKK